MCRSTPRPWSLASCSRTSAKRCMPKPTPTNSTPSSSSICAYPPPAVCPCSCCPKKSTVCASSVSMCLVLVCPPMPRPKTCWPVPCCVMPAKKSCRAPCKHLAVVVKPCRLWPCWARCFPPTRWALRKCWPPWVWLQDRWCPPVNGVNFTLPSTAPRWPPSILFTPRPSVNSKPQVDPLWARLQWASKAHKTGCKPSANPVASRKTRLICHATKAWRPCAAS